MSLRTLTRRAVGIPRLTRALHSTSLRASPFPTTPAQSSTTATQPHPKPPSASFHPSTSSVFTPLDTFLPRHLGPRQNDVDEMLKALGYPDLDAFVADTIPKDVRIKELTDEDAEGGIRPYSELELRRRVEEIAGMNKPMKSYIGMG